jgi:alpha-amylase/alpha-mannosidase (GH57 family)
MKWVLFLHFYQPTGQDLGILKQVVSQSYWPLLRLLAEFTDFRVSVNINGSLVEQLAIWYPGLLEEFKRLVARNQVELVASAKHHAILP